MSEAYELLIFDRASSARVNEDWMPVGSDWNVAYPESFLPDELPTEAAAELLSLLEGCPTSRGLRVWLASVRGSVSECEAQEQLA